MHRRTGSNHPRRSPARRIPALAGVVLVVVLASACNGLAMGRNIDGRLGDGTTADRATPVGIAPTIAFDVVDAGDTHSCGISDGELYCWGSNVSHQLGATTGSSRATEPVRVGSADDWTAVSAGGDHTCGIRGADQLFCWGANGQGQVLPGGPSSVINPALVGGPDAWIDVSAGQSHTCAIVATGGNRHLSCWGHDGEGRLGNGSAPGPGAITTPIDPANDWTDVEAGVHTCGRRGGRLYCWGGNGNGQLGTGNLTPRSVPTRVGTATDWVALGVGERHTCGIRGAGGHLLCWGRNANGQLGTGDNIDRLAPTSITGAFGWRSVSAGGFHTCGERVDMVACWGANAFGALGDGTTSDRNVPVALDTDMTGVRISAGRNHTLVIGVDDAA